MADPTRFYFHPDLSDTRFWNVSFHQFEVSAGFTDLRCLHFHMLIYESPFGLPLSLGQVRAELLSHFENDLQFDRRGQRKACDAKHRAARVLVFAEDILQQLRGAIRDLWLIANISRSRHKHAEPNDSRDFVERSQMVFGDSETVERREPSCLSSRFRVELRANAPNEFCSATFCREHPGQKKQITRPHRFGISAERFRRRREFDPELFQPLLRG